MGIWPASSSSVARPTKTLLPYECNDKGQLGSFKDLIRDIDVGGLILSEGGLIFSVGGLILDMACWSLAVAERDISVCAFLSKFALCSDRFSVNKQNILYMHKLGSE